MSRRITRKWLENRTERLAHQLNLPKGWSITLHSNNPGDGTRYCLEIDDGRGVTTVLPTWLRLKPKDFDLYLTGLLDTIEVIGEKGWLN